MKRLGILFLLISMSLSAQNPAEEENGIWYMYFGMNRISDKLSIHTEAQFRYYETSANFNQLLLRTGLNYHINPNAIATMGYAYIDTDPTFGEFDVMANDILVRNNTLLEHRIFEQFILTDKVGEFLFEHRYRLEQRFFENRDFNTKETQHRARYRLQVMLPLTDTFFMNFYNEVFLNLQGNTFDQNRLYGALGVRITENSSLQLGYLKNHFADRVVDRFQIGLFYNPDLRGK
ncbi:Hypothetical protein I595_35 [Croceitalea dokdonensis DOKDO 023]|uniref:DUF2490 domain-containing protein n=1 Tax=Croceitalea dokdonensis DOKDO 023 TaxID=1300341 RepID=A0A0P7AWN9_9FLAO|nr:DUF2490 domain-containing protein [Croceitalea dokdonensis]KPM33133.1 Hypothetical protein I595_35 [Croceitalea dokdonensis DOKDO 023]